MTAMQIVSFNSSSSAQNSQLVLVCAN